MFAVPMETPSDHLLALPSASFRSELITQLSDAGFAIFPELLRKDFHAEVRREIVRLEGEHRFNPAQIGKRELHRSAPGVRGDGTCWFEPSALSPTQTKFAALFESIRESLNRSLYLGLWDWEGHYAIYPPGRFYQKHVDRFSNDSRRKVSMVFFFNPDWTPEAGGMLRLHLPAGPVDVAPLAGTAVFFLSDVVPHEVIETRRDRYSFAGWFRSRPAG